MQAYSSKLHGQGAYLGRYMAFLMPLYLQVQKHTLTRSRRESRRRATHKMCNEAMSSERKHRGIMCRVPKQKMRIRAIKKAQLEVMVTNIWVSKSSHSSSAEQRSERSQDSQQIRQEGVRMSTTSGDLNNYRHDSGELISSRVYKPKQNFMTRRFGI